jgi:hypothetical protein
MQRSCSTGSVGAGDALWALEARAFIGIEGIAKSEMIEARQCLNHVKFCSHQPK